MLVKVQYQGVKKFIKLLNDFTLQDFLSEVQSKFGLATTAVLQVFDDTETSVEEDIFQELIEASPNLCLTIRCLDEISAGLPEVISPTRSSTQSTCTDTLSVSSTDYEEREPTVHIQSARASSKEALNSEKAKQNVQDALEKHSGGEDVLTEYQTTKTLKHSTRRQLVNIVVSHMTETYGRIPTRKQRETYAMGIVTLFPALRDPFSAKGYEHFYDPVKGTGFISWRLKTLSRKNPKRVCSEVSETGGPSRTVYFVVDKLFTEHFSEHHHAFKVQRNYGLSELIKANALRFYRPFDLQCPYGSDGEYIVPSFLLV